MSTPSHETACPVCQASNSQHATVCASCGSYIQNRVPTLDLFRTAWGIVEHPARTFRVIARAEHKNYAVFLFALGGVMPTMWCFHLFSIGQFFPSLLTILPMGIISGLILGTVAAPLASVTASVLSRLTGGDGSYRNALGTISYALVPGIALGIITLPIQWLTFGTYQFTLNPHPETINPASYWALNIIQWLSIIWSGVLMLMGLRIAMRTGWLRAVIPSIGVGGLIWGLWYLIFLLLWKMLLQDDITFAY